jgi:uncharacterized membrane protein YqaE (UPF0057 family)
MKNRIFTFIAILVLSTSFNHSSAAILSVPAAVPDPALRSDPDPTTIKGAIELFKSLTKKERKGLIREAKKEIKLFKANKREGKDDADTNTLLLVIVAILLPPLAVYLHDNAINTHFWISLILTLLFWLPGVIYALVIVLSK